MESLAFDPQLLQELARHQAWADAAHWKAMRENSALLEDSEIRKRLNHMLMALQALAGIARGEMPDRSKMKEIEAVSELEAALGKASQDLLDSIKTLDLQKNVAFPRGPQGPFDAPAGAVLLQAITHCQHHRGQNASRMRQLGATPPMTDFIIWYALGRP